MLLHVYCNISNSYLSTFQQGHQWSIAFFLHFYTVLSECQLKHLCFHQKKEYQIELYILIDFKYSCVACHYNVLLFAVDVRSGGTSTFIYYNGCQAINPFFPFFLPKMTPPFLCKKRIDIVYIQKRGGQNESISFFFVYRFFKR